MLEAVVHDEGAFLNVAVVLLRSDTVAVATAYFESDRLTFDLGQRRATVH